MSPILKKIGKILLILMAAIGLSGFIYTWTDTDGIKHYSNIAPPAEGDAKAFAEEVAKLPKGHQFNIVKIFDGDTVLVEGVDLRFTIRLVGIDTPELGRKDKKDQPYSQEAKQKLTQLLGKKRISLTQYGTGGYNRVLAEIFVNETNINLEMVRAGLAEVYRGKRPGKFDPTRYFQAEKLAKDTQKGMWVQGNVYKSPGLWRRELKLKLKGS